MRSILAGLRTLVLPWGAGPGTSRIVAGPDLPPELVTFYGATLVGATIRWINASGDYHYKAVLSGATLYAEGIVTGVFVYEIGSHDTANFGFPVWTWGRKNKVSFIVSALFASTWQWGDGVAVFYGGISQPRGRKDFVSSTVATAAIAGETVVLTGNSIIWTDGRAYSVEAHQVSTSGGGATLALFNFRRTNLAGAIKLGESVTISGGGLTTCQFRGIIVNTSGADITDRVVLTLASFPAGTVTGNGAATTVRWLEIRDIGAATDYAGTIQI